MNCECDLSHRNAKLRKINISWETFKKYSRHPSSKQTYEEYVRENGHDYNVKQKNKKIKKLFY